MRDQREERRVLRFHPLPVLDRLVVTAGRGGKIKTVTQAVAVILYLLPLPDKAHIVAVIVMGVAWVITMVTGLDYVREALRLRRRAHARG